MSKSLRSSASSSSGRAPCIARHAATYRMHRYRVYIVHIRAVTRPARRARIRFEATAAAAAAATVTRGCFRARQRPRILAPRRAGQLKVASTPPVRLRRSRSVASATVNNNRTRRASRRRNRRQGIPAHERARIVLAVEADFILISCTRIHLYVVFCNKEIIAAVVVVIIAPSNRL